MKPDYTLFSEIRIINDSQGYIDLYIITRPEKHSRHRLYKYSSLHRQIFQLSESVS